MQHAASHHLCYRCGATPTTPKAVRSPVQVLSVAADDPKMKVEWEEALAMDAHIDRPLAANILRTTIVRPTVEDLVLRLEVRPSAAAG